MTTAGAGLMYFNLSDRTAPRGIQLGKDRSFSVKVDNEFEKVTFMGVEYRLESIEVSGIRLGCSVCTCVCILNIIIIITIQDLKSCHLWPHNSEI